MQHYSNIIKLVKNLKEIELTNHEFLNNTHDCFINAITENTYTIGVANQLELTIDFILDGYSGNIKDSIWDYILLNGPNDGLLSKIEQSMKREYKS